LLDISISRNFPCQKLIAMLKQNAIFIMVTAFLLNAGVSFCQTEDDQFKVKFTILEKKVRKDEHNENELKCVVTINAPMSLQYNFGERLHYSYKEYHDEPCYVEAMDRKGKDYYIKPTRDIDWIYDPIATPTENIGTITDTISTTVYKLAPGKYKLRWAFKTRLRTTTYYSNWEDYEVLPR
jgi:hypothetical protein